MALSLDEAPEPPQGDSLWSSLSNKERRRAIIVAVVVFAVVGTVLIVAGTVALRESPTRLPSGGSDNDGYTLPLLMPASPWLAQATVPEVASAMASFICPSLAQAAAAINSTLTPASAGKPRDEVWLFRAVLDLYPFAWGCAPSAAVGSPDPWTPLRALLDTGYEALGSFKDLELVAAKPSSSSYTSRLKSVLTWSQSYLTAAANDPTHCQYAINATVSAAVLACAGSPPRMLSDQYWGLAVPSVIPCAGCPINQTGSGLAVARILVSSVLQKLIDSYPDFIKIDLKHNTTDHTKFELLHDYKKRVRSVIWMPSRMIDEVALFEATTLKAVETSLATLNTLYDQINDVKDALVAWQLSNGHASQKALAAAALRKSVATWSALQKWCATAAPLSAMSQLQDSLAGAAVTRAAASPMR